MVKIQAAEYINTNQNVKLLKKSWKFTQQGATN